VDVLNQEARVKGSLLAPPAKVKNVINFFTLHKPLFTLRHTTNAIYWFSVKKLVTLARLLQKNNIFCHMNCNSLR